MVQLSIIIAFIALHVRDALEDGPPGALGRAMVNRPGWAVTLALTVLLAILALMTHFVCVAVGRRIDRSGSIASVALADRVTFFCRVGAMAAFLAFVFAFDWLGVVRDAIGNVVAADELLALLPLLLFLATGWASMFPIDRRLRDAMLMRRLDAAEPIYAPRSCAQFVLGNIRHQMALILIPATLITTWHESLDRWLAGANISPSMASWLPETISLVGSIGIFIICPALLRLVWDAVPLGPGEFREMLTAMAARYRVRLHAPLVWRTHGSMVNGLVLGLVWPFRYMIFTDALLERLKPRQVEAVAAHEIAHVRHRHILFLALAVIGTILMVEIGLRRAAMWLAIEPGTTIQSILVGLPLLIGGMVFGLVSRRFEWQADAFSVRHLSEGLPPESPGDAMPTTVSPRVSPVAMQWMTSALQYVAAINGVDPTRFGFRHGSIDERVRRLRALVGLPVGMLPIDRTARAIKAAACLAFIAGIGGLVFEAVQGAGR